MLRNYLRIAFRTLLRNKSYVIINTFGLGIALACCITAYIIVAYNIEFDDFHADEKVKNIYKVHSHFAERDADGTFQQILSPYPLGPGAAADIAGIESYTRILHWGGYLRAGDQSFNESMTFVDTSFFSMFDIPLKEGNYNAFKDKHSVFITDAMAEKYFGTESPVGKTMIMNFANDKEIQVVVGGVFEKIPLNNTMNLTAVIHFDHLFYINSLEPDNWSDWRDPSTFFKLADGVDPALVGKQLSKYTKVRNDVKKDVVVKEYRLEHFKSKFTEDDIRGSYVTLRVGIVPLLVFMSMALMILLIACFNLTNTSIALTAKRLKEVGVRKAIGAARRQIVSQFLLETILTITLSMGVGFGFAQIIVPPFTEMWNLHYSLEDLGGVNLVITVLLLIFIASLIAGIYPALFQSGFKPVSLLKGRVNIKGSNSLTRSLVGMQFALSVIVLVAGVMFIQNTKFQQGIDFGYEKDKVLIVDIQSEREYDALRAVVERNPKVAGTAVSDSHLSLNNYEFPVLIDTTKYQARMMAIGKNYCEVMGLRFLQGRAFNMDSQSDVAEGVIVNQAFVDKVGLVDPLDKVVTVHEVKRHIIGVIDNHIDNLYRTKDPEPFVLFPAQPKDLKVMLVKTSAKDDLADVQKSIEKTWKELYPTKAFQSRFQDEAVTGNLVRTNSNLQKIFLFLTVLGGVLSASGIYSLASLNIARRTKEIGIRKALGASVQNVVLLLNREFFVILSIAAVIGGVGGYYLTLALLDEIYAYHVAMGFVPIMLCGLAVFLVGILTTSSATYRAAKANPVDSLRTE